MSHENDPFHLLNATEKACLLRLSVFVNGWTLKAAEAVCSGEDVKVRQVLELLQALMKKNLVIYEEAAFVEGLAIHEERYRLEDDIRQSAHDQLIQSGDMQKVRQRHRDYFLKWAEEAQFETDERLWLNGMERERDNLLAVLEGYREEPESGESLLRLLCILLKFWLARGCYWEGREQCRYALSHPGTQAPTKARAEALFGAGRIACFLHYYREARALFEESLTIRHTLGDRLGAAQSLSGLGSLERLESDYLSADGPHHGDSEKARSLYAEALALYRELDNRNGIISSLSSLGSIAIAQGEFAKARSLSEEAHRILETETDHRQLPSMQRPLLYLLNNLVSLAKKQGDVREVHSLSCKALLFCRELGDKRMTACMLESLAGVVMQQEQPEKAARLLSAADSLRETIGSARHPDDQKEFDRCFTEAETRLGKDAFAAAFAEGHAMSFEQAIAYALEEAAP